MHAVHIEEKDWSVRTTAVRLADALRKRGEPTREFTLAEAVVWSGIPRHLCEPALAYLVARESGRVGVGTGDELTFRFLEAPRPPTLWRLPEGLQHAIDWLRAPLREFRKITVGMFASTFIGSVALLWMFVLWPRPVELLSFQFVAVAVLAVVAVVALAPAFLALVVFFGAISVIYLLVMLDIMGAFFTVLGLVVYSLLLSSFLPAVYGLGDTLSRWLQPLRNFGRERSDDLSDERRLTDLVAWCDGVVTSRDLARLFGWTRAQAHREMTRLLVDYGGDIVVTDEGALTFHFPEFSETKPAVRPPPVWQRERPPVEVFDAAARRADWVALGLSAVAIAGLYSLFRVTADGADLWAVALDPSSPTAIVGWATAVMLFAALAFLAVRRAVVALRQRRWDARVRFLDLVRRATTTPEGVKMPIADIDAEKVAELDGTLDVEAADGSQVILTFEAFALERAATEGSRIH